MSKITTKALFRRATADDLQDLVEYVTKPVTGRLDQTDQYKEHSPDHTKYAKEILEEIKAFGANTIVNFFRGGGPRYREVVADVADKIGVPDVGEAGHSVADLERRILEKILKDAMDSTEGKDRAEIEQALKDAGVGAKDLSVLLSGGSAASVIAARLSGFALYRVSLIVANAVAKHVLGRGLSLAANAALTRSIAVAVGPIGWVFTGLWTVLDLAGPAYRVTIPCVIHVAMLRQKYLSEDEAARPTAAD
ncbi:MAG: hypothetical protein OXI90_01630 [Gammaproteobacteria bacterium]|nr:hypothetical protein [Gammaproteobacteria bacterium]